MPGSENATEYTFYVSRENTLLKYPNWLVFMHQKVWEMSGFGFSMDWNLPDKRALIKAKQYLIVAHQRPEMQAF